MPTAVEFEFGNAYTQKILRSRGIPESAASTLVGRGRSTSAGEGRTLFTDDWTLSNGLHLALFVIALGNKVLTAWIEEGPEERSGAQGDFRMAAAQKVAPSLGDVKLFQARGDFRMTPADTNRTPVAQLQAFSDAERKYYAMSDQRAVSSFRMEPLVIGDYAGDGSVRGIEIVGKQNQQFEYYLKLAQQNARGSAAGGFAGKSFGTLVSQQLNPHSIYMEDETQVADGSKRPSDISQSFQFR